MEQRNFINSEIIKPSLMTSKKLSFTRINVMLVLGAIASVSVAIPVTMSLISQKQKK